MLTIGTKAPSFSLPDQDGKIVSLEDYKGKKVVLYFYPKDNTPGCTAEACSFKDNMARVKALGAIVIGISGDSAESHVKFREKYGLTFPLLSDPSHDVIKKYDAWKKKSMYGKTFLGIRRTTVIIDEKGVVTHLFPKVKVKGHVDEVLEALRQS